MNVHRGGPITIGSAGTTLWQVNNVRLDPGIEKVLNGAANTDTVFAGAIGQKPMLSFETPALATALGLIGFAGALDDEVDIYFPKLANGGILASGSVHTRVKLHNTLGLLRSIAASIGSEANAQYELFATFDGTNGPIEVAHNVAMPSFPNPITPEKFTVGPVEFNGTAIEVQETNFDTGITEYLGRSNGALFTELAAIVERRPEVTLQTLDLGLLSTVGLSGGAQNTVDVWFRALTNQSVPAADTATSHVKIALPKCYAHFGEVTGPENAEAPGQIVLNPINDGANAIATISTGQAIEAE